jgi:hypothetical protein
MGVCHVSGRCGSATWCHTVYALPLMRIANAHRTANTLTSAPFMLGYRQNRHLVRGLPALHLGLKMGEDGRMPRVRALWEWSRVSYGIGHPTHVHGQCTARCKRVGNTPFMLEYRIWGPNLGHFMYLFLHDFDTCNTCLAAFCAYRGCKEV